MFHATPRLVMADPPAASTSPPHMAELRTLLLTGSVATVGATWARRPCTPAAWTALMLALYSFVAISQ